MATFADPKNENRFESFGWSDQWGVSAICVVGNHTDKRLTSIAQRFDPHFIAKTYEQRWDYDPTKQFYVVDVSHGEAAMCRYCRHPYRELIDRMAERLSERLCTYLEVYQRSALLYGDAA